ncbi:hypothetical protein JW949_02510 [Candidatus Woesearchaeota archaeon]|nr:hypothetical protein [Candidatus Woesearchaeota archaeon]
MSKKSQVWVTDIIISLIIFTTAILLSVKITNTAFGDDIDFENVEKEADYISEILMSQGFPENWNKSSVIRPGLLNREKTLDISKLNNFCNLTYPYTKTLFSIRNDYYFFFRDNSLNKTLNITKCGFGSGDIITDENCSFDLSLLQYNDLVKIRRFLVYDSTIIEMDIYVWN